MHAMLGRISHSLSSFMLTAGSDKAIRYWDLSSPGKCYTVSGMQPAQPKSIFDSPKLSPGTHISLLTDAIPYSIAHWSR